MLSTLLRCRPETRRPLPDAAPLPPRGRAATSPASSASAPPRERAELPAAEPPWSATTCFMARSRVSRSASVRTALRVACPRPRASPCSRHCEGVRGGKGGGSEGREVGAVPYVWRTPSQEHQRAATTVRVRGEVWGGGEERGVRGAHCLRVSALPPPPSPAPPVSGPPALHPAPPPLLHQLPLCLVHQLHVHPF